MSRHRVLCSPPISNFLISNSGKPKVQVKKKIWEATQKEAKHRDFFLEAKHNGCFLTHTTSNKPTACYQLG